VLYACDLKWWNKYHAEAVEKFKGEMWSCDKRVDHAGVNKIEGVSEPGLSLIEGVINQIVLLGFDCQPVDGKAHWFGQHPKGLVQNQPFNQWQQRFPALAEDLEGQGVEVINCSQQTALTCFRIEKLENV
jgi:hypothetical protein